MLFILEVEARLSIWFFSLGYVFTFLFLRVLKNEVLEGIVFLVVGGILFFIRFYNVNV